MRLQARLAVCLVGLIAACGPATRPYEKSKAASRAETWVVVRDPSVARGVSAPTAPALTARPARTAAAPELVPLTSTRITATLVGPIATIERTKLYATPHAAADAFVSFTPPASPARQDWTVRVGTRALVILVRDRHDADAVAREQPGVSLITADATGHVAIPVGAVTSPTMELAVDSTGLVPWRDGAYELTVPRVPDGDVALATDLYGPGPIVVVSSPSHTIDVVPESLAHLRVALRDPATLRDDDFVLRYRVDPDGHPGALVVEPDGAGNIVGLVVHPFEDSHEPVAASDVAIDWNGARVTDVRPAAIGPVSAGTPLVVLARAEGGVAGPVTLRARVGRQTRSIAIGRDDAVPRVGVRALALLWARAPHVALATR